MKIDVGQSGFRGEGPRFESYLLPEDMAQVAMAPKLLTGDIEPWREPEYSPPDAPAGGGPLPKSLPHGEVRFTETEYTAGSSSVTLYVERVNGSAGAISVDFATHDGSARAPTDYEAKTQTLHWADGNTDTKAIIVDINYAGPKVFPWINGSDPRNPRNDHKYTVDNWTGTQLGPYTTLEEALLHNPFPHDNWIGWAKATAYNAGNKPDSSYDAAADNPDAVWFHYNKYSNSRGAFVNGTCVMNQYVGEGVITQMFYDARLWQSGYWYYYIHDDPHEEESPNGAASCGSSRQVNRLQANALIKIERVAQSPDELTFTATLSNPTNGAHIGTPSTATVVIPQ